MNCTGSPPVNPLHTLPITKAHPKPYLSFLICKHDKELHCYVNGLPIGVVTCDLRTYQPETLTLEQRLVGTGCTPSEVLDALQDVLNALHTYEIEKQLMGEARPL